jgi:polyisoprenoid-binding protein YceI
MITALITVFLVSSSAFTAPATFVASDAMGRNIAVFESNAPLEKIVGTTNQMTGTVIFDPSDIRNRPSATISVDLTGLKTGIDLRDEHMRSEQYLNTSKYPTMTFTLDRIISTSKNQIGDQESADVVAEGTFDLHGVRPSIVSVRRLPGDG